MTCTRFLDGHMHILFLTCVSLSIEAVASVAALAGLGAAASEFARASAGSRCREAGR